MKKLKISAKAVCILLFLCVWIPGYSQTTVKVVPGKSAGKILLGKLSLTAPEIQEALKGSNGSVCFRTKDGYRKVMETCATSAPDGVSVVTRWLKDSTLSDAQQDKIYFGSKINSVIIEKPAIALTENGQALLGRTKEEIGKIYTAEYEETSYRSGNKVVVYYSLGIAFSFDPKTGRSVEVEVFAGENCFIVDFCNALKMH